MVAEFLELISYRSPCSTRQGFNHRLRQLGLRALDFGLCEAPPWGRTDDWPGGTAAGLPDDQMRRQPNRFNRTRFPLDALEQEFERLVAGFKERMIDTRQRRLLRGSLQPVVKPDERHIARNSPTRLPERTH